MLESKRLIFRAWHQNDAKRLYELASNQSLAHWCGFKPHENINESLDIIKNILSKPNCFAIVEKNNNKIIGSIGIEMDTSLCENNQQCEIGFWIGNDYQNQGYMQESLKRIIDYIFNDLKMECIWAMYFYGNNASKHLQQKVGFKYVREENQYLKSLNKNVHIIINCLYKKDSNNVK